MMNDVQILFQQINHQGNQPGCEDKGEGRKEDDVADGDGERKGDDRRAASLVLQPLPEDGQQQHRHPERQQCPEKVFLMLLG